MSTIVCLGQYMNTMTCVCNALICNYTHFLTIKEVIV